MVYDALRAEVWLCTAGSHFVWRFVINRKTPSHVSEQSPDTNTKSNGAKPMSQSTSLMDVLPLSNVSKPTSALPTAHPNEAKSAGCRSAGSDLLPRRLPRLSERVGVVHCLRVRLSQPRNQSVECCQHGFQFCICEVYFGPRTSWSKYHN